MKIPVTSSSRPTYAGSLASSRVSGGAELAEQGVVDLDDLGSER